MTCTECEFEGTSIEVILHFQSHLEPDPWMEEPWTEEELKCFEDSGETTEWV